MRWMHVDPAAAAPVVRWISDNVAGPVGQVFLRMLLMTVIPLVFTSITLGVAGIGDIRRVGRVGARTLIYFLRSEEHTSELQSRLHLVCRLLLEKKKRVCQVTGSDTSRDQ